MKSLIIVVASIALLSPTASAFAAPAQFARIVVVRPREGMEARFEEGYKRHLAWHRQNNDPWSWFGWSFFLGDRLGLFIDGTFGRTAEELDRAVAPAADAADNASNVLPYAEFVSHGVYQYVGEISNGGPEPPASRFLELVTIELKHGEEFPFLEHVAHRMQSETGPVIWYRLVSGGKVPTYLVFRPRNNWAELAQSSRPLSEREVTSVSRMQVRSKSSATARN